MDFKNVAFFAESIKTIVSKKERNIAFFESLILAIIVVIGPIFFAINLFAFSEFAWLGILLIGIFIFLFYFLQDYFNFRLLKYKYVKLNELNYFKGRFIYLLFFAIILAIIVIITLVLNSLWR